MNDVGWFVPQGHGAKSSTSLLSSKVELQYSDKFTQQSENSNLNTVGPWFWFPSPDAGSDGPDFLGRSGGLKDEPSWKIKASILYSARAHPGAVRSIAVCHDECTVYTGGVGPGFKGSVQKWELERMSCISGYYGHDEVSFCHILSEPNVSIVKETVHFGKKFYSFLHFPPYFYIYFKSSLLSNTVIVVKDLNINMPGFSWNIKSLWL